MLRDLCLPCVPNLRNETNDLVLDSDTYGPHIQSACHGASQSGNMVYYQHHNRSRRNVLHFCIATGHIQKLRAQATFMTLNI